METRVTDEPLYSFKLPKKTLGTLSADTAANVIMAASDIALIVDSEGIIQDLAVGSDDLLEHDGRAWLGSKWVDTVTDESRPKVEKLMKDAGSDSPSKWRHVNHHALDGPDLPIRYSTLKVEKKGNIIAVGRELRSMSALQQTMVNAQQSMEREYARLRQAETRYRLLFHMTSEAVLILDAGTYKVIEANPASAKILGKTVGKVVGRGLLKEFDNKGARSVQSLLLSVESTGDPKDVQVNSCDGKQKYMVRASLFRHGTSTFFLIHLSFAHFNGVPHHIHQENSNLIKIVEKAPEGFIMTDLKGHILTTNAAFLDMAQLASQDQVKGEPLNQWLGRPGLELDALIKNLRAHGSIRLFATIVRGEYGSTTDVEVSVVSVPNGDIPCLGFMVRNVQGRTQTKGASQKTIPPSVEQLTKLVGRVPLKDLVRETTSMIEQLSIEAALKLTGDNRASAAEILGLSRQSLYSKLRRYGISDFSNGED